MAEFKMKLSKEWMSFSQIELVWVRVRVEWECFLNLREDNNGSIQDGSVWIQDMVEFKMAAIIKLSQNKWVKFFSSWVMVGSEFEMKY